MRAQHMSWRRRLLTAVELERFPRDDDRYELVDGQVAPMSPVSLRHGRLVVQIAARLLAHVAPRRLGIVATEVGFVLSTSPDTVRAPDVAFLAARRLPDEDAHGFVHAAPDLAVDVLSSADRDPETRTRVEGYLRYGVLAVLVVDPAQRRATVHRPLGRPVVAAAYDDVIDLDDVVAGFRCALRELLE